MPRRPNTHLHAIVIFGDDGELKILDLSHFGVSFDEKPGLVSCVSRG